MTAFDEKPKTIPYLVIRGTMSSPVETMTIGCMAAKKKIAYLGEMETISCGETSGMIA